jgi:hypothetical protein
MSGVNSLIERFILLNSTPMIFHLESNPLPIAEVDLQFQLAKLNMYLPKSLSVELTEIIRPMLSQKTIYLITSRRFVLSILEEKAASFTIYLIIKSYKLMTSIPTALYQL